MHPMRKHTWTPLKRLTAQIRGYWLAVTQLSEVEILQILRVYKKGDFALFDTSIKKVLEQIEHLYKKGQSCWLGFVFAVAWNRATLWKIYRRFQVKSVAWKRENPVRQWKRGDLAAESYFSMRKPLFVLVNVCRKASKDWRQWSFINGDSSHQRWQKVKVNEYQCWQLDEPRRTLDEFRRKQLGKYLRGLWAIVTIES